LDAATNAVEQRYAQLCLERMELARGGGLGNMESSGRTHDAARLGNLAECAKVAKVHVLIIRNPYQFSNKKFIGRIGSVLT
jgi:hypothetical protein